MSVNNRPMAISVRVRVDFGPGLAIGPGKIALLEGIHRTGSLAKAARELEMSYRRAWLLLQSLNAAVDSPVTVAAKGGSGGGGATVTARGLALIERYRRFESRLSAEAAQEFKDFSRQTDTGSAPKGAPIQSPSVAVVRRRQAR